MDYKQLITLLMNEIPEDAKILRQIYTLLDLYIIKYSDS